MVTSKFKWQFLIFPIALLLSLFFGGIGVMLYPFTVGFNQIYDKGAMLFIGFFLLFMATLILIPIIRSFYTISISNNQILVKWIHKQKSFAIGDIEFIKLVTLSGGSVWCSNPVSILIKLNEKNQVFEHEDDASISLPDGIYKNVSEIIEVLQDNMGSLITQTNKTHEVKLFEQDEVYAGNPYNSFTFILHLVIGLIMVPLFLSSNNHKMENLFFFLFLFLFITIFNPTICLFYFVVTKDKITIKNHLAVWYKKDFLISDILLIDFYSPPKRPKALRIVTKNRKTRFYCGDSLKDENWEKLKTSLIARGIPFE